MTDENRLSFREVEIIREVGEDVYITGGLKRGETISLSTVNNAIEGMLVRPIDKAGIDPS